MAGKRKFKVQLSTLLPWFLLGVMVLHTGLKARLVGRSDVAAVTAPSGTGITHPEQSNSKLRGEDKGVSKYAAYDDCHDKATCNGFPSQPISFADLRVCQTAATIPPLGEWLPKGHDPACVQNDKTCLSCLEAKERPMVDATVKALENEAILKERRLLIEGFFSKVDKEKTPIVLFGTDTTFANFSFNLACSVEKNMGEDLKARALWVATDKPAYDYFKKHKMPVLWSEEHFGLVPDSEDAWKTKVYRQASKAMMVAAAHDLLELGFHVIFTDADAAWLRDPTDFFLNDPIVSWADIAMQSAPRWDAQGPGNSGFIFIRNTFRSRIFMHTFTNAIPLLFLVDDQVAWNTLLRHFQFRSLRFWILPPPLFLGMDATTAALINDDTYMIHVVGTNQKLEKLQKYNYWYFDPLCSYYHPNDPLIGSVEMANV